MTTYFVNFPLRFKRNGSKGLPRGGTLPHELQWEELDETLAIAKAVHSRLPSISLTPLRWFSTAPDKAPLAECQELELKTSSLRTYRFRTVDST